MAIDAVFLSGTGMPTLAAIVELAGELPAPAVSSNLCLAYELLRRAGRWPEDEPVPAVPEIFGGSGGGDGIRHHHKTRDGH